MTLRTHPTIVIFALLLTPTGCDRAGDSSGKAGSSEPLHAHPAAGAATRTSIGEVRKIDEKLGTITIAVSQGPRRERAGKGPLQTLSSTAAQRARVRVGDVVEFRMVAARSPPLLLSIDTHAHRAERSTRATAQQHE